MTSRLCILVVGLCLAGFLGGFAAKRGSESARRSAATEVNPIDGKEGGVRKRDLGKNSEPSSGAPAARALPSELRSSDTLEQLLALEDDQLYARLALWMLDATEEDIASFWMAYSTREKRDRAITELCFVQWTRLNPTGAIEAVEGTDFEEVAWWAWTCHDFEAALAEAIAGNPDMVSTVAEGIGEFHPAWLLENLDKIPEHARESAIAGLSKWSEGDTVAMLDLMSKNGTLGPDGMFRNLIREDPWGAVEWTRQNDDRWIPETFGTSNRPFDALVTNLQKYHPDVLAAMAESEPPGARRRRIDQALFENLVRDDLEAAVVQARAVPSGRTMVAEMAEVGLATSRTDPARALGLFRELVEAVPHALESSTAVRLPGGMRTWGDGFESNIGELVDTLIAHDPVELMVGHSQDWTWESPVALRWAERDLDGFADWVKDVESPATRTDYSAIVISRLISEGRYVESGEWALGLPGNRGLYVDSVLQTWGRLDPAAAQEWLDAAEVSPAERARYEAQLPNSE